MSRLPLLAAFLIACGPRPMLIDGVEVYVLSSASYLQSRELESHLDRTIRASETYWQSFGYVKPRGEIRLYIEPDSSMPQGVGGYAARAGFGWEIHVSDAQGPYPHCVEGLPIPHEFGHVYGAPANHVGPGWDTLGSVWPALSPYCSQ